LLEAQQKIFAEAQAQLRHREDDLAQIEADANRESSRLREPIEQPARKYEVHSSQSNTDVEKSTSLRRIPQPPPKRLSETNSSNNIKSNQASLSSSSRRIAENTYELQQLIAQEQKNSSRASLNQPQQVSVK
jgi:hypothetical protein